MDNDIKNEIKSEPAFRAIDTAKANNLASIALIVCVVIAAVLSMGDVKFTLAEALSVSTLCIILFLVATLVYKTKYTEYEAKAMQCDRYVKIQEEYNVIVKRVQSEGLLSKLPEMCHRYVSLEIRQYRSAILSNVCISYSDYEQNYMNKTRKELSASGLTKPMIKAVNKANRAKGLRLSPQSLLSSSRQSFFRFSALSVSSGERERLDTAFNTLSRLLTTFLGGAVAVEVIFDFSWQAIAQWVLRMLPIAAAAFSGAHQGARNIEQTAIPHRREQINILTTILEWE